MAQDHRFPKLFLGRGLSFPFEISSTLGGRARTITGASVSDGVERIRQSLIQILYTRVGERTMRRGFGSDLDSFVFETLDRGLLDQIIYSARRSIELWEPRIDIRKFEITLIDQSSGLLQIDVAFVIKDTNSISNIVFPFYLSDLQSGRTSVRGSEYLLSD